jgi:hypothetical protein
LKILKKERLNKRNRERKTVDDRGLDAVDDADASDEFGFTFFLKNYGSY